MAQKKIYEYDGKLLIASLLPKFLPTFNPNTKITRITSETYFNQLIEENSWIKTERLVAKPDQLIGERGKSNLLLLDGSFDDLKSYVKRVLNKSHEIGGISGIIQHIIVEPYVPHNEEFYLSITSDVANDIIHFSLEGGVGMNDRWDQVIHIPIPLGEDINNYPLSDHLPNLGEKNSLIIPFIQAIFQIYVDQDFSLLEINPFVITEKDGIVILDLKAKLDDTAAFLHRDTWGNLSNPIEFPYQFGQHLSNEEQFIASLDEKTGASFKLKILNRDARIWTMVAGGGASIIYTDTIVDLGYGQELGNYGEYSGNPSREYMELYAGTLIKLITEKPDPHGKNKILLIGGGIANFTDVKETFLGIASTIRKYRKQLKDANVHIFVRRGGPNELEGLKLLEQLGKELEIPIEVHDRNTHMTRIVPIALKERLEENSVQEEGL